MKILTADEMRAVDRLSSSMYGVPSTRLMEQAGAAVARFLAKEFPGAQRIVVFCGMGNNGGDGLVAATHLAELGRKPRILLLGRTADLAGDPKEMLRRLQPLTLLTEVPDEATLLSAEVTGVLGEADLIVDAMVGTGFKPPLRGLAEAARLLIQPLNTPVVAVDLPSGWDADSHQYREAGALRANAVITFTAPKMAHVFGNLTGSATAPVVVASIGSPDEAILSAQRLTWAGSAKKLTEVPREADDNKGRHGHVLLIGGSHGKAGAPSMAALAALRGGAGLVTAAVADSILTLVAGIAPELMTIPLAEDEQGAIASGNLEPEKLAALLEKKTVVAVGPGLGQEQGAEQLVLTLLDEVKVPMVLDADALNILSRHKDRLSSHAATARERPLVLTPHPGEMARLAGLSIAEVQSQREPLARSFAQTYQVTLVLKGWRTLIAHPDGALSVNTTGNPGLAKGGSGDMLTGLVAAMMAQYPGRIGEAVEAAVYLHGLAADLAVREQEEHTLLVTDVIASFWKAFRYRSQDKAGYVWLQGLPT
ncbi:MAG TPA: NAD(P)H-hydrate dehydratase [Acidobacteriaceae bacterium]